ncbi:MAG: putative membrane protein [Planctomycetota bacterium]
MLQVHRAAGTIVTMKQRIQGVDALRGLVMILMVLDHVRAFFGPTPFYAGDAMVAPASWFFVRWVTHFCAPVFVLLAGTSAWFKGRSTEPNELSAWLLKRGLWLILLEMLVVTPLFLGSMWNTGWIIIGFQVIWVIGVGFLVLAMTSRWPRTLVFVASLIMVLGHNLLDSYKPGDPESQHMLWDFLHGKEAFYGLGELKIGESPVLIMVIYPLIPWIAVVSFGWVFGSWLQVDAKVRQTRTLIAGIVMCVSFVLLRWLAVYGDPQPWDSAAPILTFIQCEKYPPSLLYLLMTLGPAAILFSIFDRMSGRVLSILKVYGCVPLFFYLAHMVVINIGAIILALINGDPVGWWYDPTRLAAKGYEPSIALTLFVWVIAVMILYLPCKKWAQLKRDHPKSLIQWL